MFLEVEGVSKFFRIQQDGGFSALQVIDDISFQLEEESFLSIIGPSGCGKSTLMRLIDGLQKSDEGEVRIKGRVVTGPSPDRGMVFQNHNLMVILLLYLVLGWVHLVIY